MSRLTDVIALFYRMTPDDERALAAQLLESRKQVWQTALRAEARKYNCNQVPNAPRREDLAELKRMSDEDAESITATWNRDAQRQVEKLYADNPRGNRFYYARRMEQWANERSRWKLPQIAVTTETQTAEYAKQRFNAMNLDGAQKYVFSGPPTTCEDCTRRFAAGVVDRAYTRRYPCPRHPGCPHTWEVLNKPRLRCEELWLG